MRISRRGEFPSRGNARFDAYVAQRSESSHSIHGEEVENMRGIRLGTRENSTCTGAASMTVGQVRGERPASILSTNPDRSPHLSRTDRAMIGEWIHAKHHVGIILRVSPEIIDAPLQGDEQACRDTRRIVSHWSPARCSLPARRILARSKVEQNRENRVIEEVSADYRTIVTINLLRAWREGWNSEVSKARGDRDALDFLRAPLVGAARILIWR